MSREPEYHTGARKPVPATGPDPNDAFSQEAAKNRKPPLGTGLTETVDDGQKRAAEEFRKLKQSREPRTGDKETSTGRGDPDHPTRDTRETPAPNPDGGSTKGD